MILVGLQSNRLMLLSYTLCLVHSPRHPHQHLTHSSLCPFTPNISPSTLFHCLPHLSHSKSLFSSLICSFLVPGLYPVSLITALASLCSLHAAISQKPILTLFSLAFFIISTAVTKHHYQGNI